MIQFPESLGKGARRGRRRTGAGSQLRWPSMEATQTQRQTCYRHPDRETGVSFSNCGRPICPECMTSTPVGMRCPECARQTTKVRVGQGAFSPTAGKMPATIALIAINVIVFLVELAGGGAGQFGNGGSVIHDAGLRGP